MGGKGSSSGQAVIMPGTHGSFKSTGEDPSNSAVFEQPYSSA